MQNPPSPAAPHPAPASPRKAELGEVGGGGGRKCGAGWPRAGPKPGAGCAGAQPAREEPCKPVSRCTLTCWCKSMHQCTPTHQCNPALDGAPAPPLLCARPHPKAARGTHNAVIAPRQAVQTLATRFPLVWPPSSDVPPSISSPVPPSIPPSLLPSRPGMVSIGCPWLCSAPESGPGHLPRETGFLGHPAQGQPRQRGLLEKLSLKTLSPHWGHRHQRLRWDGKLSKGTMEKVNLGPLAAL